MSNFWTCGLPEVAAADVHDAVRQLELRERRLGVAEDLVVEPPRGVVVVPADDDLLDLLELVDAVEAARVLAVGAGLAPVAVAQADELERQLGLVEDLAPRQAVSGTSAVPMSHVSSRSVR